MSKYEKYIHLLLDLLTLNGSFIIGFFLRFESLEMLAHSEYQLLFVVVNATWVAVFFASGYNFEDRRVKLSRLFFDFSKFWALNLLITLAFVTIIKGHFYSRTFIFFDYVTFLALGGFARVAFRMFLRNYRLRGFNYRRIIMVGVNDYATSFVNDFDKHPEYGFRFMGYFADQAKKQRKNDLEVMPIDEAYNFIIDNEIDEIYVSDLNYSKKVRSLITFCYLNNVKVNIINELIQQLNADPLKIQIEDGGRSSILTIKDDSLTIAVKNAMKRVFDVGFSLLMIVSVLSWLFPIIALLIKLESKGPVLFIQNRSGLNNQTFSCLKFRTMTVNNDSDSKQAEKNDARITLVGRFLRKSNLDEFPQFFNVLMGDMSIVGPRPHMLAHTKYYSGIISEYMERHWLKPGITGLAQANGFRGETRELVQMENRVEHDRQYVYHYTLGMDFRIIGLTAWNMLTFQKGGA